MSLHYLLDGYNIVKQAPRTSGLTLEEGRQRLLSWIDQCRPQGSARNTVTVVFDGDKGLGTHAGTAGPQASLASGRVIFTHGESADDYIKAEVEKAGNKKRCVVVSDDKDVRLYTRALGAQVVRVKEFAGDLFGKPKVPGKSGVTPDGKHVSLSQAHKINKELEKIWLK